MAQQLWVAPVNAGAPWQTASGTALNTAATATISPAAAGGTGADAQVFSFYQGMVIRVSARGIWTSGSTSTNVTLMLYVSASGTAAGSGQQLATTGAVAWPVSVTNFYWGLDALIQVRAMAQGTGTATLNTHGRVELQTATFATPTGNMAILPMPATNGPTAASADTTITHTLALVGTLSQATGSPAITCTNFLAEYV
jgi:hypothetical protein